MPEHPHIVLTDYKQPKSYTPRSPNIQQAAEQMHFDQTTHGAALAEAYRMALQAAQQQYEQFGIDPAQADQGVAVELRFREGTKVDVTTLEYARAGNQIEVLNVKLGADGKPQSAILYIPPGREEYIKKQIDSYRNPNKNTLTGKPSNYRKYDRTEDIQPAALEDFWIDSVPLPEDQVQPATWELWLREGGFAAVGEKATNLEGINVSPHRIKFPEREICVIHCSLNNLRRLELLTKAISGFRFARTGGGFFDAMPPAGQQQWQQELLDRLAIADDASTSVCLLDTGIAHEHPLLAPAVAQDGVDSVDPAWGVGDHHGHGTEMAGIALFGDLVPLLEGNHDIAISHLLESVKVFPPTGQNENEHIGYITAQAVSRAEVNRPDLSRVFTLSWGVEHEAQNNGVAVTNGKPTPLSARIDQLAFGVDEAGGWIVDDERKRLLLVAAGNIGELDNPAQYPAINDLSEIEEPGQSWNALTVGGMTDKVFVNDPAYDGWAALAGPGQLSPKSRTSVLWGETYWPNKPDIVLEGGNYLASGAYVEPHPDVSPLSTDKDTIFGYTNDTSAANAEASRLAATLAARYQEFWPETLRGLMVHAAEWTPGMLGGIQIAGKSKPWKINFLRRYGYGQPQTQTLLSSLDNQPCIIIQDQLQPFKKSNNNQYVVFNDMNFYALPWPQEQLEQIYDQQVRLRVTLSYFIEPNPSERPPRTKYSYASHELRFRLNRANETQDQFLARINQELQIAEADEDAQPTGVPVADQDNWLLGPQTRDRGGVISDIWQGTGATLAGQNMIAVIPQLGWWKYRKAFPEPEQARYGDTVRYSLILSLITEAEVDLYTPIVQQIEAAQMIEIEV